MLDACAPWMTPSPTISFAGAKRGERSTAGCGRGGKDKGRRRVQVGVGGLQNTSSWINSNHFFGTSSIHCIHDVVNCSRHFDWYLSTLDVSQSTGETGLLQGVYDCFLHLGTWICPILAVLTAKKTLDIMIIFRKAYVRLCWAYSYYTNVFVNYLLNLKNLRLILVTT